MDSSDVVAMRLTKFISDCFLLRCNDLFLSQKVDTYVNISLNHQSRILVSTANDIIGFEVLDPDINLSDDLPLGYTISVSVPDCVYVVNSQSRAKHNEKPVYIQLRWYKADHAAYYLNTGRYLQPYVNVVQDIYNEYEAGDISLDEVTHSIESVYCSVLSILQFSADAYVAKRRKGFFKFRWDEELKQTKQDSTDSNKA